MWQTRAQSPLRARYRRGVKHSTQAFQCFGLLAVAAVVGCEAAPQPGADVTEQTHIVIAGEPTCPGCTIALVDVAELGSPDDPASVRPDGAARMCLVARHGAGRYLMSGPVGGGQVFVYSADGQWLESLGRAGEGPGEFGRNLALVPGPADSVYVVDNSQYRVSLLDPDGDFVRSFMIPGQAVAHAALASGNLLFHFRPSGRPGDDRALFHMMDPSGQPLARFGTSTREDVETDQWVVSSHPTGGFWTGSVWKYELFRWQNPDSLVQTVTREVDWFPPGGEWSPELYASEPPPPQLMHVTVDERGMVWTYSWVPDANWQPNESRPATPEWSRRNFDTIVEVIDLTEGSVIAAERSDEMLGHACKGNLAYAIVETAAGDMRVRVLEPRLIGRE